MAQLIENSTVDGKKILTVNNFIKPTHDVEVGSLHLLKAVDRIESGVITDTPHDSWDSLDFSPYVPAGTKAVVVSISIWSTVNTQLALYIKEYDSSYDTTDEFSGMHEIYAGTGRGSITAYRQLYTILAPEGKFYYREHSSNAYPIANFQCNLHGYYI